MLPAAQVFPLQHPLAQLVESQTQVLVPEQRCPAAQAGFVPHLQSPVAEQLSAAIPQATQALPLDSHDANVGGLTQLFPLQQPPGQLVASQTQPVPVQC